jgi:hypothetical protein
MGHAPRGRTTVATIVLLAVLVASTAAAFVAAKPIPFGQIAMWSDAIVVGVLRESQPPEGKLVDLRKTIDVEQWIVPTRSKTKTVQINGGNSYKARFGRRLLLFLRWPTSPRPSADYSALRVIDLEDARDVAQALEALNRPWIPYVSSTTSYRLTESGSPPIKLPPPDPRLLEIELILRAASRQSGGR